MNETTAYDAWIERSRRDAANTAMQWYQWRTRITWDEAEAIYQRMIIAKPGEIVWLS